MGERKKKDDFTYVARCGSKAVSGAGPPGVPFMWSALGLADFWAESAAMAPMMAAVSKRNAGCSSRESTSISAAGAAAPKENISAARRGGGGVAAAEGRWWVVVLQRRQKRAAQRSGRGWCLWKSSGAGNESFCILKFGRIKGPAALVVQVTFHNYLRNDWPGDVSSRAQSREEIETEGTHVIVTWARRRNGRGVSGLSSIAFGRNDLRGCHRRPVRLISV